MLNEPAPVNPCAWKRSPMPRSAPPPGASFTPRWLCSGALGDGRVAEFWAEDGCPLPSLLRPFVMLSAIPFSLRGHFSTIGSSRDQLAPFVQAGAVRIRDRASLMRQLGLF